jgi:calcineurin-like phosphoesterase
VLAGGTAFITDIGMTGSHAGCIGMEADATIARFLSPAAPRPEHSKGDVRINAVLVDVDETTGRAREISRLSLRHES